MEKKDIILESDVLLEHAMLRADMLSYFTDNDDDPINLLQQFAERLRVLIDCDQVIYRDLTKIRVMQNSPEIEKTWAVPADYCNQCRHLDPHDPIYSEGVTEMSDCHKGFKGVPTYKDCPIKSSLTRIVYMDGRVAGYLAIHYVNKCHEFTEVERLTLQEFCRIISLSLSRYAAKTRNEEYARRERELREREARRADEIIRHFAGDAEYSFSLNLEDESLLSLKQKSLRDSNSGNRDYQKYSAEMRHYIDNHVYQEDRMMLEEQASLPNIRKMLAASDRYHINYRDNTSGYPLWYTFTAVKLSDTEVLINLENRNEYVLGGIVSRIVRDDFISAFYCDLDADVITEVKKSPFFPLGNGRTSCRLSEMIKGAILLADDEYKDALRKFYDVNLARKLLVKENRIEFVYSSHITNVQRWVKVIYYVASRREDGVPATLVLTYCQADQEQIENIKLQKETIRQKLLIQDELDLIRGLSNEFEQLQFLDMSSLEEVGYHTMASNFQSGRIVIPVDKTFYQTFEEYFKEHSHPDDFGILKQFCHRDKIRAALGNKNRYSTRVRLRKDVNEDYFWYDFVIIKLDDSDVEPTKVAIGLVNVDDIVKRENERIAMLEEARLSKEAEKERYNFLVNVAHELRTPLTLIKGPLSRFIKQEPLSDKGRETIRHAIQQADKMTILLNTVLTTNKLEEGADTVQLDPINYNDWVASVTDEFRDEADTHDMVLDLDLDPRIGVVKVDEHLCKIVLSNLLVNAIRHNDPGKPIKVSTSWTEAKDAVRVSVTDRGTGIGDIDVSKLFVRYYRATEEKTGFGIGLSYSKTIIDAHSGKIGAFNNAEDKGATFWFELPADYSYHIRLANEKPEVPAPEYLQPEALKDKVLLYVEDNKDLREYVCSEMNDVCAKVLTAYNGRNALELMETNHVDIVVTDVMMPEIDGLELCTRIKMNEKYSNIPVVMLSARADVASIEKGYEAHADYYLDKPFEMENLITVLERILRPTA